MSFWSDAGSFIGGAASPLGLGANLLGKDGLTAILTGGGSLNYEAAMQTNAANIYLNRENRDWLEKMSNSAYQRAMADMKKAGLNPMLAFSQGGASTPQNTAPTVDNPMPGQQVSGLLNSAKSVLTGLPAFQNTQADTKLKETNAELQKANIPKVSAEQDLTENRNVTEKKAQKKLDVDIERAKEERGKAAAERKSLEAESKVRVKHAKINSNDSIVVGDALMKRISDFLRFAAPFRK